MDEIINYEWIDPSGCIWLLLPGSYNLNITFLWIYYSRKSTNYNCISIDYIFFCHTLNVLETQLAFCMFDLQVLKPTNYY
jgi:hypothetical protein